MPGELQVVLTITVFFLLNCTFFTPADSFDQTDAFLTPTHNFLQGFVGTQAYMAPEVFTRNMHEGHGRAADIWFGNFVQMILLSNISAPMIYDS